MARFTQDEVDNRVYTAGVDLYIENEVIEECVQNTWYSPTTAQLSGLLEKDFDYVTGSIRYIGTQPIKVLMISNTSINIAGGLSADVEFTNGKNGVVCDIGIMPVTSTLNGKTQIATACIFDLVNGDTLDLFLRQTSETGTPNITINKGRYTIIKLG